MKLFCKACRLDLAPTRSGRCPECGEAFDPLLFDIYREPHRQKLSIPWRWLVCVMLLLGIGVTYEFVMMTSAQEGHSHYPGTISQLQTCRSQLGLYANQHNDAYPTLAQLNDDWRVLTSETNIDGEIAVEHDSVSVGEFPYGPYLQKAPVNRITGSSRVAAHGQSTASDGWEYDPDTGHLRLVVLTQDQFDEVGFDDRDVVVAAQP